MTSMVRNTGRRETVSAKRKQRKRQSSQKKKSERSEDSTHRRGQRLTGELQLQNEIGLSRRHTCRSITCSCKLWSAEKKSHMLKRWQRWGTKRLIISLSYVTLIFFQLFTYHTLLQSSHLSLLNATWTIFWIASFYLIVPEHISR